MIGSIEGKIDVLRVLLGMIWLQVAVIIGATTLYSDAFETECDPARGVPSKTGPLSEKMKLPESYKVGNAFSPRMQARVKPCLRFREWSPTG